MSIAELTLWLCLAIIADIMSLIPYLGVVVSWPFAGIFYLYKIMIGIPGAKAGLVTLGDFFAEGIFSTLPANTIDVVVTYYISKNNPN